MEFVAPLLAAVVGLRLRLENGEALSAILASEPTLNHCDLGPDLVRLRLLFQQMSSPESFLASVKTPHRQAFYELLWFGLNGRPILSELRGLEEEIQHAALVRMEHFLSHVPIQVLLVVILFQVPAFMLLILGPLMKEILQGVT